jgi:hypothetical protein
MISRIFVIILYAISVSSPRPELILLLQAIIVEPIVQAYLMTPVLMLYAKIVPHSIEGMMTGLIYSIIKFNTEFLMRVVAILIGISCNITYDNYRGLSRAYYISLCLIVIWPVCVYLCNINREDVNIVQVVI